MPTNYCIECKHSVICEMCGVYLECIRYPKTLRKQLSSVACGEFQMEGGAKAKGDNSHPPFIKGASILRLL